METKRYTIIHKKGGEPVLKDVDEETALAFLKITRRKLEEKVQYDELVRGTWRVKLEQVPDKKAAVMPGFTVEEWERFREKWKQACYAIGAHVGNV